MQIAMVQSAATMVVAALVPLPTTKGAPGASALVLLCCCCFIDTQTDQDEESWSSSFQAVFCYSRFSPISITQQAASARTDLSASLTESILLPLLQRLPLHRTSHGQKMNVTSWFLLTCWRKEFERWSVPVLPSDACPNKANTSKSIHFSLNSAHSAMVVRQRRIQDCCVPICFSSFHLGTGKIDTCYKKARARSRTEYKVFWRCWNRT